MTASDPAVSQRGSAGRGASKPAQAIAPATMSSAPSMFGSTDVPVARRISVSGR